MSGRVLSLEQACELVRSLRATGAVVVFTNGPGIPITIQMAPYREGPNDSIEWLPREPCSEKDSRGKSDLLTDWWS